MTFAHVDGADYVAAAYLVLIALLLVYFAVMASRLSRIERELAELGELAAKRDQERPQEHVPA